MKIFKNKHKLRKEILNIKNLCFIPTMGGLHKGHISLIKRSKKFKGFCIVSIFVNPKQFNEKKDFANYPRNIKRDLKILNDLKVDFLYLPNFKDIFSFTAQKKIYLDKFSKKLCGKYRANHFKGVLNVVNRLLEIIKPKYIFLGNKDFQQLQLIKLHIKKRYIPTRVIACKTVRENNGIACSTRNNNLKKKHISIASNVYKFLLEGLDASAFGAFRSSMTFDPDEDGGQVEARILFSRTTGSNPIDDFSIADTVLNADQGADTAYPIIPNISFFVGDTIETNGIGNGGKFKFQIKSTVPGTFTTKEFAFDINR